MKKTRDMKGVIKHLQKYKDLYALLVAIVAAFSTFICSLVSITALQRQVDIEKEQTLMQKNLNQPIFNIYSVLSCDKEDDDIKGTESLYIENNGQKYISCDVDEMVFFSLEKFYDGTESRVLVEIPDYFFVGYPSSSQQSSFVYLGEGISSNRRFGELYKETLNTDYKISKIILVSISYTDIYNEKHVKYYKKNQEIEKHEYDSIIDLCRLNNEYAYRINEITLQTMIDLLKQQHEANKN